jgi:hypothetical protein
MTKALVWILGSICVATVAILFVFVLKTTLPTLFSTGEILIVSEQSWDANLSVERIRYRAFGRALESSSTIRLRWDEASFVTDHYRVNGIDGVTNYERQLRIESAGMTLMGLKSDTQYTFWVIACIDEDCDEAFESESTTVRTAVETWEVQGSGQSGYEAAHQVVDNGSTLSYALSYGDWAPKDLQGSISYYYNGQPDRATGEGGGVRVAASDGGTDFFEDVKALFVRECDEMTQGSPGRPPQLDVSNCPVEQLEMFAFQVVPLTSGAIRLFFEASAPADEEHITQIYSLDSQDGYVGQDFNSSVSSDICGDTSQRDLIQGGDCEPELLIGSSVNGYDSGLTHARQHKVGYPIMDSWLWNESPGTFMVITGADECGATRDGLFYAVWSGRAWDVEQEEDCAMPLVEAGHGPVLVHLGEERYKLYYEHYQYADDKNNVWDRKPFLVMYADGMMTGKEGIVEFGDWEDEADAREVEFVWSDGTTLTDDEEAGLGDHMIWLPEGTLNKQVMYMNLGGFDNKESPSASNGLGMAVLLNP